MGGDGERRKMRSGRVDLDSDRSERIGRRGEPQTLDRGDERADDVVLMPGWAEQTREAGDVGVQFCLRHSCSWSSATMAKSGVEQVTQCVAEKVEGEDA